MRPFRQKTPSWLEHSATFVVGNVFSTSPNVLAPTCKSPPTMSTGKPKSCRLSLAGEWAHHFETLSLSSFELENIAYLDTFGMNYFSLPFSLSLYICSFGPVGLENFFYLQTLFKNFDVLYLNMIVASLEWSSYPFSTQCICNIDFNFIYLKISTSFHSHLSYQLLSPLFVVLTS